MEAAGAVLVGALNMGEYAYDFTGENAHDGPSRNPHDPDAHVRRLVGRFGGGGRRGMVPLALGSDTNGSIRVPASLCGLFGLKPTYGRLSRAGTFPFVASLDHLGPLARSVATSPPLRCHAGPGHEDPAQADGGRCRSTPTLEDGATCSASRRSAAILRSAASRAPSPPSTPSPKRSAPRNVDFPEADRGTAAAYLITTAEGARCISIG